MATNEPRAPGPSAAPGGGPGKAPPDDGRAAAAGIVRKLVRGAWKATLSTVSRTGGTPYGSLVAMATLPSGAPLLLLSGLAEHTRNILADRRASVLVDGTDAGPAALTGARVTLVGRIVETGGEIARHRYLSRHPDAAAFIDFGDFGLYALEIEWAHLVAGFGRIVRLDAAEVTVDTAGAEALVEAEPEVLLHMNEDHADALQLMAGHAAAKHRNNPNHAVQLPSEGWRMVACDPEGIDLAAGAHTLRLAFPRRIKTPDDVRRALVDLVRAARTTSATAAEKAAG